ncbi:ATP-grasp domain-containing protein [Streptomyces lavendulae]|uniref:ATP-grasp domain-containing protein n=1 Tax=Streptomyces lavendulae TaxID=1914 RepID=UPI0038216324
MTDPSPQRAAETTAGTVVLLEAPPTGAGEAAVRLIRERDHRPVVLTHPDGRMSGETAARLREAGALISHCRTDDTDAVTAHCRGVEGLAAVTTLYEFSVQVAADAAARLRLTGPDPLAVRRCRSKALLRAALEPHEDLNAVFGRAETVGEALAHAERVGYPVVVKATTLAGSAHITLCATPADVARDAGRVLALDGYLGFEVPREVLVEEYLAGEEFSVEIFHGQAVGVNAKVLGRPPRFIELGHEYPARIPAALAAELVRTAERAVAATGLTWGPAHVELRCRAGRDRPRVIEVNPRVAGDRIAELVRLADGVDLFGAQLDALLGRRPDVRPKALGAAAVRFVPSPGRGVITHLTDPGDLAALPGVREVRFQRGVGDRVARMLSNLERLGHVIATGRDTAQAVERAENAIGRCAVRVAEPTSTDGP